MLNLEYSTYFDKVIIDFTSSYTGKTRIPQHQSIEECYSTPYLTFNSQITRRFKLFDIYLGVENISNYKQKDPILASNDPNSSLFDTALIYAPISGRMGYFGFRFKLK